MQDAAARGSGFSPPGIQCRSLDDVKANADCNGVDIKDWKQWCNSELRDWNTVEKTRATQSCGDTTNGAGKYCTALCQKRGITVGTC